MGPRLPPLDIRPSSSRASTDHPLFSFSLINTDDLCKALKGLRPSAGCGDSIPSRVILENLDLFADVLVLLVNSSFTHNCIPPNIKEVRVTPILKKFGADPTIASNLRPITGVNFLLKVSDKVAVAQFQPYLESTGRLHHRQSGFRAGFGTETALLELQTRMLSILDRGKVGLLVLLDLSAAFDLLDHERLLDVLRCRGGCSEDALAWFRSFLSGRTSRVSWGEGSSPPEDIWCGVPQGSCLSPTLFNVYLVPFFELLDKLGVCFTNYADDTQLLLELSGDYARDTAHLNSIYLEVKNWMSASYMCLNTNKTELLLVASKYAPIRHNPVYTTMTLDGIQVPVLQETKTLGVYFESDASMDAQADHTLATSQYHLRLIRSARPFLKPETLAQVSRALILPRIDYCNGLYGGSNYSAIMKLQVLQNDAVRVVTGTPRNEHISEHRRHLHWLPVSQRIQFKLLCLAYRCSNQTAPKYLRDLCKPHAPPRCSRSSDLRLLHRPIFNRVRAGGRAFPVRAARAWNNITEDLRVLPNLDLFKKSLKTYLFN